MSGDHVQVGPVIPPYEGSVLVEHNGLYYIFQSDPASLGALKSIEAYRVDFWGEAGLLAVPASKAKDVEALKLCWID